MSSTDDSASGRRFGLGGMLVFALCAAWLWRHSHRTTAAGVFAGFGAALGLLGAAWPAGALALRRLWMKLARLVGTVNTMVLLTVIFFVVFTPMGMIRRLLRRPEPRGWEPHERRPADHFDHPY
jgi:hypothetical protein